LLAALLLVAAGAAGLFVSGRFGPTPEASGDSSSAAGEERSTPTSPPTQEWLPADAPPAMEPPEDIATDAPFTPAAGEAATVHVSSAGWNPASAAVEVNGFLPSVAESGGTCTVTLTNGSASVSASGPAVANGNSTACEALSVPRAQLSSGHWRAVLSYESQQHRGASTDAEVDVP
jgi:hypothetical protein